MTAPRLLDQVRAAIRVRHYSRRTEDTYVHWVRRFILFHSKRHPRDMGEPEITAFLTHLAVEKNVAASTQNQALSALLFLYQKVLEVPLDWLDDVVRARWPERLPVVFVTRGQVFYYHIPYAILPRMARPLRLEFAGGLYHVTARGDGREDIYLSEADREMWLEVFVQVCKRFNWICHAWCQMDNHYHLLIETPEANLSKGMRQLNGVYTQRFNRAHGRVGHVFQGRYKAILVERDSYLLELARYIVLNPMRAKMVKRLEAWPWSSYLATCGQADATEYLQTDWILAQFGRQRASAIRKYVEFVHEGARLPSVWMQLQGQIYLGSDAFVKKMRALIEKKPALDEIPRAQRRTLTQALADFERRYERNEAIARAYLSGQHTMAAIAQHFGVHYTTVSRLVSAYEDSVKG